MGIEAGELSSFLASLRDDVARLAFADWIDEQYPATPVKLDDVPKGLHRWWHKQGLHRLDLWQRYSGAFGWSGRDIMYHLRNWCPNDFGWMDHGGASIFAGHPVVVGEPYAKAETCLKAAAELQRVLGCPVSYSRRAAWNDGCRRITVWFTFPAPLYFVPLSEIRVRPKRT